MASQASPGRSPPRHVYRRPRVAGPYDKAESSTAPPGLALGYALLVHHTRVCSRLLPAGQSRRGPALQRLSPLGHVISPLDRSLLDSADTRFWILPPTSRRGFRSPLARNSARHSSIPAALQLHLQDPPSGGPSEPIPGPLPCATASAHTPNPVTDVSELLSPRQLLRQPVLNEV